MKITRFRAIVAALFLLVALLDVYGAEAKGYKIVLASFATFDEAKAKLNDLAKQIGDNEKKLQNQYGFEIVARPSGKAFMLAIEPLEREEDAKTVLQGFKQFCPDGYINGYFGPTEGAVFLPKEESKPLQPTVEANQTHEENVTASSAANITESSKVELSLETPVIDKDSSQTLWMVIGVLGIIALGLIGWLLKGKKSPHSEREFKEQYEEAVNEEVSEDRVEVIESEAYSIVEEAEVHNDVIPKQFVPESDIFEKLKKNSFFMTLLGELKGAAETKDHPRCIDLMSELMRYQKNFKKSAKMDALMNLVEAKEFERLATFINNEME